MDLSQSLRVILVGNYPNDSATSMDLFAEILEEKLPELGVEVTLLRPKVMIGKLKNSGEGLGKWLGYIDKYLLFPFALLKQARSAKRKGSTLFHVCDHSNAMYLPYVKDLPHLITCHDLLAVRSALGEIPQNRTGFTGRILQGWILKNLARSGYVSSVSRSTADDLDRLSGHHEKTSNVIYNGLNYQYEPVDESSCQQLLENFFGRIQIKKPKKYLFHVGSTAWYKNRQGLLNIYTALLEKYPEAPPLVIAGKPHTESIQKFIDDQGLGEQVLYVGSVSNEELNALYSGAELFLLPSLFEGFGWPIIEALASGCRVLTSNRAPMTEIGGDGALYIDPDSPSEAAEAISRLLSESVEDREKRVQTGLEQAEKFTTSGMVGSYLETYKKLIGCDEDNSVSEF